VSVLSRIVSTIVSPLRLLSSWITKLIPGFRRLAQISLPARFAWMTFVFLLIVLGAAVLKYFLTPQRAERDWLDWGLVLSPMLIVIPITVYYLVKVLLQKPVSLVPDIDRAWQIGIAALERQQIPIRKVPLFLVLGTERARQVRGLMEATQISTSVEPPEGDELPLLWYANSNAIFVFLNTCCNLSTLAARRGAHSSSAAPSAAVPATAAGNRTIDASLPGVLPASPVPSGGQLGGTPALRPQRSPAMTPASDAAKGTLVFDPSSPGIAPVAAVAAEARSAIAAKLTTDDLTKHAQRLRYVCDLLHAARRPICAANGILAVTPFDLVETATTQTENAIQKDLEVLRDRLSVRCPATLMISEMENVDGFLELVKRVGDEHARESRFGKGCSTWGDLQSKRLDAVAAHAVGSFEVWIYRLFQSADSLRRRYNGKLVSLLCRTRGPFATSLRSLVRNGFGYNPQSNPELSHSQFLFTGCYFAATGKDEDHRAFVKGVFEKLVENQGELEWAPKARREDEMWQTWANIASLIGMAAIVSIGVGLVLLR